MSTSTEAIEPTQVWTREEWLEQQPWGAMPNGDLRRFFKEEAFIHIYSGGPRKYTKFGQSSPTGRFSVKHPPLRQQRRF